MLLDCAALTIRSLKEAAVWHIVLLSAVITFILWVGLVIVIGIILHRLPLSETGWIHSLIEMAGISITIGLGFMLFPFTFPMVALMFADYVAAKIEQNDYGITANTPNSFLRQIAGSLSFLLLSLVLNIIALPFYLVPFFTIPLYLLINGYLLGREGFDIVGARYFPLKVLKKLRQENRYLLLLAGMGFVGGALIPIVNFFVPVLIVVFMVHFYQHIDRMAVTD